MLSSGHAMQLAWGPERIILYNDAYAPMLGVRHPAALGIPFRDAWSDVWDDVAPLVARVFAGETVTFDDLPLLMTRHGYAEETRWSFSYSPVRDETGAVAGLLNVPVDVSAKHHARMAVRERDDANARLQENERRFRALVTAGANTVYRLSPDWRLMVQLDSEGLVNTTSPTENWMEQYIPPEDLPAVRAAIAQAVETRSLYALEHRVRLANGGIGWVLSRAVPLTGPDGRIAEWFGAATDISTQREATRRLRESQARDAFLLRLTDAIRPLVDAAVIQSTASRLLAEHLGVHRSMYCEFEGEGSTRKALIHGQYADEASRFPDAVLYTRFVSGEVRRILQAGGTLAIADTAHDPVLTDDVRATWLSTGIAAIIVVGLVKNGVETAHFSVQSAHPRAWTDHEVALVRDVAERTWAAIERARAEAALQRTTASLTVALAETERARAALQLSDEAKDRFLAVLSHELRNPLAAVSAAATVLGGTSQPVTGHDQAIAIVDRQTRAMKVLLDDLLDISRLRLGKLNLKRQAVALVGTIEAAVESTRALVEGHEHTLTIKLDPTGVPAGGMRVDGDPLRLTQAVSNLLTNAVKYTPDGGRIELNLQARDATAVIEVSDNGIGLEPDQVEPMFGMFTQGLKSSGQGGQDGLGIGLALVRGIVELHGGRAEGRSAGPGQGSRFTITLPLLPATPGESASGSAGSATAGTAATIAAPSGPRVLLVDDNADVVWSISMLLKHCDMQPAHTGMEGLRLAQERLPDVGVLDLGLPDMSGLDLARAIRALPGGRDVLLVAATGWGRENDRIQALAAGFDAHLVKPISIEALKTLIEDHAGKRR